MAKIQAVADFQESSCPACGASIHVGTKTRKRKVQCPKCREIIELGKPEPVAKVLPDVTSLPAAELEALLARLEMLEARVAALEAAARSAAAIVPFPGPEVAMAESPPAEVASAEDVAAVEAKPATAAFVGAPSAEASPVETQPAELPRAELSAPEAASTAVASLAEAPSPVASVEVAPVEVAAAATPDLWVATPLSEPSSPETPARKLCWLEPSDEHRAANLPGDVQEALCYNLTTVAADDIVLRASPDNLVEWRRATQFKAIFQRAHWRVAGPHAVSVRPAEHGLALAVGSLPPSAEAAGIYLALTAAGFCLESILDPSLGEGKAALVVG